MLCMFSNHGSCCITRSKISNAWQPACSVSLLPTRKGLTWLNRRVQRLPWLNCSILATRVLVSFKPLDMKYYLSIPKCFLQQPHMRPPCSSACPRISHKTTRRGCQWNWPTHCSVKTITCGTEICLWCLPIFRLVYLSPKWPETNHYLHRPNPFFLPKSLIRTNHRLNQGEALIRMPPGMTLAWNLCACNPTAFFYIPFSLPVFHHPLIFLFIFEFYVLFDLHFCSLDWPGKQDILAPDQPYEGPYGQGPPSVHSNQDGGRSYRQGTILVVLKPPKFHLQIDEGSSGCLPSMILRL